MARHAPDPAPIIYPLRSHGNMITPTPQGVLLDIRVVPRAGRAGLAGTRDEAFLVRVNAPPVEGAANMELIKTVSETLGVPKRAVTIVAGERSRLKRVLVEGVTVDFVNARFNVHNSK